MYINPVLLPQFSNREDLLLTVGIFDDDTGVPVSLTGTQLVGGPGGPAFTGAAWTVTDGAIVTASATSITIPTFPISNQLTALALTVGAGLGILPGDAIKIADATGTRYMIGFVTSYMKATGAMLVQVGNTYQFEIRSPSPRNMGSDYTRWFDIGAVDSSAPLLTASLGNGITVIDVGIIQISIPETTFRQLEPKTYMANLTMTDGSSTRQVFIGRLPVFWGGVSQ